jgi:hypothetical protein
MTRGAGTAGHSGKKPPREAAGARRVRKTECESMPSIEELREQLEVRTRERDEALEQQAATDQTY